MNGHQPLMMSRARGRVAISVLLIVFGVVGILTIGWLFLGRPQTRLTYFGPTVLMLMSACGLVSLIAHGMAAFIRSRRN